MCDTWWHFLVFHVFYTLPAEIYVGALIPYPGASWSGFPGVERSAVCFETGSLSLLASIWRPWFFFTFRNLSQLVTVPRRSDHTSILLASSCWSHQTQPQRLTFYIPLLPWKPLWGLQVGPSSFRKASCVWLPTEQVEIRTSADVAGTWSLGMLLNPLCFCNANAVL